MEQIWRESKANTGVLLIFKQCYAGPPRWAANLNKTRGFLNRWSFRSWCQIIWCGLDQYTVRMWRKKDIRRAVVMCNFMCDVWYVMCGDWRYVMCGDSPLAICNVRWCVNKDKRHSVHLQLSNAAKSLLLFFDYIVWFKLPNYIKLWSWMFNQFHIFFSANHMFSVISKVSSIEKAFYLKTG